MPYGGKDAASRIPQTERIAMAGMFELFVDTESAFRFRVTAPDGTIMVVSKPFNSKTDAVAGIAAVREYAGMGLITDSCPKVNEIPNEGMMIVPFRLIPRGRRRSTFIAAPGRAGEPCPVPRGWCNT